METYSANFGARCMNRAVAECSIAEAEHFTGVLRSKIQSSNDDNQSPETCLAINMPR